MKRITNLAILALLGLSSCTQEFTYDPTQEIQENAENIFGLIDPNQDWRTTTSGTVTVTANAPLSDIAKVQILTESPFFNRNARILAEAEATAGQTVTLSYDAPRELETLVAACVDSKGHHFIKAFDPGTTKISFAETTAKTRGVTRADDDIDVSGLTLDASTARWSINSTRTFYANLAKSTGNNTIKSVCTSNYFFQWADSKWENEMVWQLTSNSTINGWNVAEGTVVREIDDMSSDEEKTLNKIFTDFLSREKYKDENGNEYKVDNLEDIRNGSAVKFFNNHLTSQGQPITLIPVQMASIDMPYFDVYYYYYNPDNKPSDMSEADYIKQLPKFKAINCQYTLNTTTKGSTKFFKKHEYLLPYYGDNTLMTSGECTTDGNIYRIRNGEIRNNKSFYLTDNDECDMGKDKMQELISNGTKQLWQIFTTKENRTVLYNIGSGHCLIAANDYVNTNDRWGVFYTDFLPAARRHSLYMEEAGNDAYHIWYDKASNRMLGSNINKHNLRVATDKTTANGNQVKWYLDKYEEDDVKALPSLTLEGDPATNNKAVSAIIPQGYRVGFMIRRLRETDKYMRSQYNGCIWGYGELNRLVNQTPQHFGKALVHPYTMKENDPRIAMFNANEKTYLAIEDGSDCNFSDMILELTGMAGMMFDDVHEVEGMPYTMCFEDRPNIADYDMNDVVLRCERISPTKLQHTIVATGAQDDVYLKGIEGTCVNGTDFNDNEVHSLLGVPAGTYVNTEPSTSVLPCVSAEYEVSEDITIPQFLSEIYIVNHSQNGNEIHVPSVGQPPYALIVPGNFDYPAERVSIINAYEAFSTWANNAYEYGKWLDSWVYSKLYINPYNRKKTD